MLRGFNWSRLSLTVRYWVGGGGRGGEATKKLDMNMNIEYEQDLTWQDLGLKLGEDFGFGSSLTRPNSKVFNLERLHFSVSAPSKKFCSKKFWS